MSSTGAADDGSAGDQAYFRALEAAFLELRGTATLLSAEDWRAARDWRRLGIPLELVLRVMAELFARQRERKSKRGISSLRYFRAAIEAAWEEQLELSAGGHRRADPGPPLDQRLRALAEALPADLPERATLAAEIGALGGDLEGVEAALSALDARILAAARARLTAEERRAIGARVDRAVGAALAALPPAQVADARERLEVQALRERLGLPLLSLFSATALGPPAD